MMKIRSQAQRPQTAAGQLFQSLSVALAEHAPVGHQVASRLFATESIGADEMTRLQTSASSLQSLLASITSQHSEGFGDSKIVSVQETAAVAGALSAYAMGDFLSRDLEFAPPASKDVFAMSAAGVPNYLGRRPNFATESFDNRADRSAVLYTMAYNYSVARQEEFGETVWPTLTLPSDQVGFGIVVDRLTVHRGVQHSVSGAAVDFGKVDLMRAMRNPNILQKDKTRCFPIVRAASASHFVAAADIAPYDKLVDGVVFHTAPYKFGIEHGIIGLSQTDAMLAAGAATQTDTLDPTIILENIYAKIGADIVKFNVRSHSSANFTFAPQGQDRQRNLTFATKSIVLDANSKCFDGSALVTLADLATDSLTVVIEVQASGTANIERGSAQIFANRIASVKVLDVDGEVVPSSNPAAAGIIAAVDGAVMLGYDLLAYKTNMNMRERGDFIDRTRFTMLYEIPLLSPVTAQRPIGSDGSTDGSDFEALVQATRFRIANDGVTAILDTCNYLDEHVRSAVINDEIAPEMGAARYHVKPVFFGPKAIDVVTLVDSISSAARTGDLQAALVNTIRETAIDMFINSEYQAAAMALGLQGQATLIIATDPKIHTYLMLNGDLRTLTEKFKFQIVSTLDERMEGKVFLTFGVFDENRNQAPHLLNFGNLVMAPEVVLSAPTSTGGSVQRETIVSPRYRFINVMPVAAMLQFTNIPGVLNKVPLNFHSI